MNTLLARLNLINPLKTLREAKAAAETRRKRCFESLREVKSEELVRQRFALAAKWAVRQNSRDLAELVQVELRLLVANNVEQAIVSALRQVEEEEIRNSAGLIRAALEEAGAAIRDEREAIVAADLKRSEELGVECTSDRAIEVLDRKLDLFRLGRSQLLSNQPGIALNTLFSLTPVKSERQKPVQNLPSVADAAQEDAAKEEAAQEAT